MSTETQNFETAIKYKIDPEIRLSKEHHQAIASIARVWLLDPALAQQLEQSFVAICNGRIHY